MKYRRWQYVRHKRTVVKGNALPPSPVETLFEPLCMVVGFKIGG